MLTHSFDELGIQTGADMWCRFNLLRFHLNHLLHRVGQSAQYRSVSLQGCLYHNDTGVDSLLRLVQAEF